MYRVVRVDTGETVLIATRREDAEAFVNTDLDDVKYSIEQDRFVNKKVDKPAQ